VAKIVDELRASASRGELIAAEFASLVRKLPDQDAVFDANNLEWVDDLLESAAADLLGRFE
jgi:hypothetical protein